jgi:ammonia channel protein AmtB
MTVVDNGPVFLPVAGVVAGLVSVAALTVFVAPATALAVVAVLTLALVLGRMFASGFRA